MACSTIFSVCDAPVKRLLPLFRAALLAVSVTWPLCAPAADDPAATVRDLYAAFNSGSMARIEALLAEDVVWIFHGPEHVIPYAGTFHGRAGVAQFFAGIAQTIEVHEIGVGDFVVAGNQVGVPGWERARGRRTGGEYTARWLHLFTVEGGLITRFEEFTDSAAILEALAPADVGRGRAYYTTCAACHGANGEGDADMRAPALTVQGTDYLVRQLRHFRSQVRGGVHDTYGWQMNGRALALPGDRGVRDVAAWIATLPAAAPAPPTTGDAARGAKIYAATCAACHGGGDSEPVAGAPNLVGLQDWYQHAQLLNFRQGLRGAHAADTAGAQMRAAIGSLSDRDLRDVAAYAAGGR